MKLFQNSPRRPRAQASSLPRNPPPMMVMDFTWREIDSSRLKSSILRKSVTRSWKSSPTPLRLGNVLGRPPVIKGTSGFIFHSLPSSKNESTDSIPFWNLKYDAQILSSDGKGSQCFTIPDLDTSQVVPSPGESFPPNSPHKMCKIYL